VERQAGFIPAVTLRFSYQAPADKVFLHPRARPASPVLCPIHATLSHGTKIEHRLKDAH